MTKMNWVTTNLSWLGTVSLLACSGGSTLSPAGGADASAADSSVTTVAADPSDGASEAGLGCSTDQDCATVLAALSSPPTPAGCAEAYCNMLLSQCAVRPVDGDGDGYRTAACAVSGVPFTPGTDCNDDDPNLYPGHPEACTNLADGGTQGWGTTPATGVCAAGQVSCNSDGTESACVGEVPECAAGHSCVSGQCTGVCSPGETACSGSNGTPSTPANAVWSCSSTGIWVTSATCTNQTCQGSTDGGIAAAACDGVCAPGQTNCGGTGGALLQTCTANGSWSAGTLTVNSCTVVCTPGQTKCGSSNETETCTASGQWGAGVVSPGQCGAVCTPGSTQCSNPLTQTCQADGTWSAGTVVVNSCGAACAPGATQCVDGTLTETCAANATWPSSGTVVVNSCGAVCTPGQTRCANPYQETCTSAGVWGSGVIVAGQCGAQCTPGQTEPCARNLQNCSGTATCTAGAIWGSCLSAGCTSFDGTSNSGAQSCNANFPCAGNSCTTNYTLTCPAQANAVGCTPQCVSGSCGDLSATLVSKNGSSAVCQLHMGVSGCSGETGEEVVICQYPDGI